MVSRSWLGTWMPTVDLPAMRSMRMLGAHGEAEVVGEAGDAAVFDAGFGLELVGGDHGAGIDLDHLAADVELGAFFDEDRASSRSSSSRTAAGRRRR
jgi:hypothetical protein